MDEKFRKTFDQIHADEELKSSTMKFLKEEREKRDKKRGWGRNLHPVRRNSGWMRTAIVFCMLFIIIGSVGCYYYTIQPYAYISIDASPSLELVLNKNNKVIRAAAYNKEGENVLADVNVKGMSYTDAIKKIMQSDKMKQYLGDQYDLVITTASGEKIEYDTEIQKNLSDVIENVEYVSTNLNDVEEAHSHHCSVGKYTAYKELAEYEPDLTTDDCEHMSVGEIHDKVAGHEEECEEESCSDCNDSTENNGLSTTQSNDHEENGHQEDGHECDD